MRDAFAALAARDRRRPQRRRRSPTASSRSRSRTWPNAIKKISVQRGYDVTRYALNCFGGAGGQHACLVADALGMTTRADPSVLVAALGLRHGARRHPRDAPAGDRAAARRQGARRASSAIGARLGDAARRRSRGPRRAGAARSRSSCARISAMPAPTRRWWWRRAALAAMQRAFEKAHKARFGFVDRAKQMVVEAVVGRGGRRRRQVQRARAASARAANCRSRRAARGSSRAALARSARVFTARAAQAGPRRQGAGPHHRAASDHRGRARLAGRAHGEESSGAHPRQEAQAHACRSARRPIR